MGWLQLALCAPGHLLICHNHATHIKHSLNNHIVNRRLCMMVSPCVLMCASTAQLVAFARAVWASPVCSSSLTMAVHAVPVCGCIGLTHSPMLYCPRDDQFSSAPMAGSSSNCVCIQPAPHTHTLSAQSSCL